MDTNQLQAYIDGLSMQFQRERSASQMTLGKLIERLKEMPEEKLIDGIEYPHSYRGYYSDLAFERASNEKETVADVLEMCCGCMGKMFEGYKGDYRDWETDRKSTRLNSSHRSLSRMPSSA